MLSRIFQSVVKKMGLYSAIGGWMRDTIQPRIDQLEAEIPKYTLEFETNLDKEARAKLFSQRAFDYTIFIRYLEQEGDDYPDYDYGRSDWLELKQKLIDELQRKIIQDYTNAIAMRPEDPILYSCRAEAFGVDHYNECIRDYEKAIELYTSDEPNMFQKGIELGLVAFLKKLAKSKVEAKEYDLAIQFYSRMIELRPDDATTYLSRALAYRELKKHNEAIADLQKCCELDPDGRHKHLLMVEFFARALENYNNKDFESAISDTTHAISAENNPMLHINRARMYKQIGNMEAALSDYNEALKFNSNRLDAFIGIAYIHSQKHNYSEAILAFSECLKLNPTLNCFYERGYCHLQLKNYSAAVEDFTSDITKNKGYAKSYAFRAEANIKLNKNIEVIRDCDKALEFKSSEVFDQDEIFSIYLMRGHAHAALGHHRNAIADLNTCEKTRDNFNRALPLSAYIARGDAYLATGHLEDAISDYTYIINKDSTLDKVFFNRARAHQALGQFLAAIEDYNHSLERQPNNSMALENLSSIYYEMGNNDDAALWFATKALERAPTTDNYLSRAKIYKRSQQLSQAIADCNEVLKSDPDNVSALFIQGNAYYRDANFKAALFNYQKILSLAPGDTEALNNLGSCYMSLGLVGTALSKYTTALTSETQNKMAYDNLKYALSLKVEHAYDGVDKKLLFDAIKQLTVVDQYEFLMQALIEETPLGKRFWHRDGVFKCSLSGGTLAMICLHLKTVMKDIDIRSAILEYKNKRACEIVAAINAASLAITNREKSLMVPQADVSDSIRFAILEKDVQARRHLLAVQHLNPRSYPASLDSHKAAISSANDTELLISVSAKIPTPVTAIESLVAPASTPAMQPAVATAPMPVMDSSFASTPTTAIESAVAPASKTTLEHAVATASKVIIEPPAVPTPTPAMETVVVAPAPAPASSPAIKQTKANIAPTKTIIKSDAFKQKLSLFNAPSAPNTEPSSKNRAKNGLEIKEKQKTAVLS